MTEKFSEVLADLKLSLAANDFHITTNLIPAGQSNISLAASRTKFSWKGLVIISQHMFVVNVEEPSLQDFNNLVEISFKYAKKINRIPLPRGVQFGYMIIPCVAANRVDDRILEYVQNQPKKRWSIFEFPVLYDLEKGEAHYFKGTPLWGAFYFSDARRIISSCFGEE